MKKHAFLLFIIILITSCSKKLPKTITNSIGMEFILVEEGIFKMGDEFGDGFKDESPVHDVFLSNYYIGKYEVIQKEWLQIDNDNPSSTEGNQLPVERVSWNDVNNFIEKLNSQDTKYHYRLPTEAEWEKAAKGGNHGLKTRYAGADDLFEVGFVRENSPITSSPVGMLTPNELGIYDMSGNVGEWCSDWYSNEYYAQGPTENPQGPENGDSKIIRGGSWYGTDDEARVNNRDYEPIEFSTDIIGFRLVLELKE
jgi:formylglycine-generating enzyme required for sulfatase activity